jgi:hypothetical protein
MLGMVLTRALLLKKKGTEAMNFGKLDKTGFLIPLFAIPDNHAAPLPKIWLLSSLSTLWSRF